MSRLIDADAMLQRLQAWNTADSMDKAHYNFTWLRIMEQPTAYDVDKVIKEFESKQIFCDKFEDISIFEALDIVKRGGIDESI